MNTVWNDNLFFIWNCYIKSVQIGVLADYLHQVANIGNFKVDILGINILVAELLVKIVKNAIYKEEQ